MAVKPTGTGPVAPAPPQTVSTPAAPAPAPAAPAPSAGWLPGAAPTAAPEKRGSLFERVASDIRGTTNKLMGDAQNLFSSEPASNPTLGSKVQVAVRGAGLILGGVPGAIPGELKKLFEGDPASDASKTVAKLSDAQLKGMSNDQLGALAKALGSPGLLDKTPLGAAPGARSTELLRVLTAHGTDAGHIDAISSRMGYLKNPLDAMEGTPKAQLQKLLQAGAAQPGNWAGFQSYMDSATGTSQRPGTQVTPLINGSVAFPKMYDAIDQAKSSVSMSSFGFDSDGTGWAMAKHLAAAADRGCQVRLIYDPMGSDKTNGGATDPKIYDFMRQHGVQVIAQKPGPLGDDLTHRKVLVVDGNNGFIGGMNVGDDWSTHWHDVHSEVKGTGVADLQNLFVSQWKKDGGSINPAQEQTLFPQLKPVGNASARIVGHVGQDDQNMKLAYLRAIDTAQKSINIADPYFSDPDVVSHLEAASKRGVDVKVVLPQHNDKFMEQDAERALYNQLTQAGVHVYEYHGAPMAHEKVATFDGNIATIGSSNLDARSLSNNDEANVWTSDPSIAQQLDTQLFAKDLTQSRPSTEYKPGMFGRFMEDLAHQLSSNF